MSIQIDNISKSFIGERKVDALQNISFEVQPGKIFGLIGPDGAGKTTLFRILTTLILADKGQARVQKYDVIKDYQEIRRIVGYMPGKFSLYQDLSVYENLKFFATIFGTTIEENYNLIKDIYIQLEPFRDRKAGALSGGMKQKLALCCALVHRPQVLFLDEPTTGVDVVSRAEFWDMLKRLQTKGITILASTPYMDEAGMCDEIALIQDGQILSINTPLGLINDFESPLYGVSADDMYQVMNDLKNNSSVVSCRTFGAQHHVQLIQGSDPHAIQDVLEKSGHNNVRVELITPTIEDCFMNLMQQ